MRGEGGAEGEAEDEVGGHCRVGVFWPQRLPWLVRGCAAGSFWKAGWGLLVGRGPRAEGESCVGAAAGAGRLKTVSACWGEQISVHFGRVVRVCCNLRIWHSTTAQRPGIWQLFAVGLSCSTLALHQAG